MSSYSTDLVISKLSNLSETQDSITSVSQWVLFHRRAANETVQTWLQCLREASTAGRKLNLVYLANEVAQQSRARRKDEFPKAFSSVIAEAMEIAYRGTTPDVQNKLRRVIDVWRNRAVFEPVVLDQIDQRLDAIDRGKGKGGLMRPVKSGSGPAIPAELNSLISSHNTLSSLVTHAAQTQASASSAYSSLLQSDHLPSPPVYLPRLTQLLKSLNDSKEATLAVVKARTGLVRALETFLDRQKRELAKSQSLLEEVDEQVKGVQFTRDEVQNMMDSNNGGAVRSTTPDIEPPVIEALTPPATTEELLKENKTSLEGLGNELAGLENLDPEIVALLKADMGLNRTNDTSNTGGTETKANNDMTEEYAP